MTRTKPRLATRHVSDLLKTMLRIRMFEETCADAYTREKIRGFLHLYDGEEAIAAGIIPLLETRNRLVATYREDGHALARGVPMGAVLAEMYGKAEGCAGDAAGRCTFSTANTISAVAMPSWVVVCPWRSGLRWPTGCRPRTR